MNMPKHPNGPIVSILEQPPAPPKDVEPVALGPIESNELYKDRFYIPLPAGWEIQTKGSGSSFRICDTKTGERLNVCPQPYLYETLELMGREIHAACTTPTPAPSAERQELVRTLLTQAEEIADAGHNGWGNTMRQAAHVLLNDAHPPVPDTSADRPGAERLNMLLRYVTVHQDGAELSVGTRIGYGRSKRKLSTKTEIAVFIRRIDAAIARDAQNTRKGEDHG